MHSVAAIVKIPIDQDGSAQTSTLTTHKDPIYREEDLVHCCVTDVPAIVPHTSTYALTNATLSYALEFTDKGLHALHDNPALRCGLNTMKGRVTHPGVTGVYALPCADGDE